MARPPVGLLRNPLISRAAQTGKQSFSSFVLNQRLLTSIAIPASVESIGAGAFSGCGALTTFDVDFLNPSFSSLDGVLFNKGQSTLILYPAAMPGAYRVPNGVTASQDESFAGCSGLTAVAPKFYRRLGGWRYHARLNCEPEPNDMRQKIKRVITIALTTGTLLAALDSAAESVAAGMKRAPLFDVMGNLHHAVTAKTPLAQRYFDQGLTLCYGFNHTEAIRSFQAALAEDPECAMAHWGIAYAYGPHVNKPMSEEDNVQAWAAIQKAVGLKAKVGAKEQAFIGAMAARYQAEYAEDRSALDKAYAAAMREVVKRYPDDLDAQTLFAEALMDTMPWDYWTTDRSPKPETEEAFAALRLVLKRNPDHPGANHLYIHAVEAGPNPELGLAAADRLVANGPRLGHLVHMPSHIYVRVGRYRDATEANERATEADWSYIESCRAQGFYPGVYYPHNVHFLWYANLFEGRSAAALKAAELAARIAIDNVCGPSPAVEAPRFRHLPWLTRARFGQWDAVLAVARPPSTNDFLIDRVMWHFTRGLALAAKRDVSAAVREHEAMMILIQSEEAKELDSPTLPATGILAVADHFLAGKIAAAREDRGDAIDHLQKAVAAEDALPYMEPAFWPFPTRPALGVAYLEAGDAEHAERVFREDLDRQPRNGWGLLGLASSLRAQGRAESADIIQREFTRSWERADVPLELAWF